MTVILSDSCYLPQDAAVDMWGAGCCLAHMLLGR